MTVIPLAHFGHWYVQILFVAPVVLLVGALSFQSWRENRRRRKKESPAP
jgi:ABC-type transport system involved in Fe-S cluster assembly fused permease/ATPase subunit